MATYLQNGVDELPKQELHTPDFSFLTNVLGAQQERYKKGFSIVRNMYNSALNGAVTSTDSEQYKQDVFKKIKGQMQDISGLDLSQTQNIATASGVFDPLTKDRELLYDMHVTRKFAENSAVADRYKNSMDGDTRAKYNPASVLDMQFAKEDLRNAKRGDGSIFGVSPREFVPQEDVNKFLDERAGKDGFKIVKNESRGMYLVKTTNGEQAVPLFSEWAKRTMGNRFDPQFQVQASVAVEQKVRQGMAQGMTREESIKTMLPEYVANTTRLYQNHHSSIVKEIGKYDIAIKQFDRAFPNGIKDPEKQSIYDSYVAQKKNLEGVAENTLEEAQGVEATASANPQVMLNNMKSMMYTSHKDSVANAWGKSKALMSQDEDIKTDEVKMAYWQNEQKINQATTAFERALYTQEKAAQNAMQLAVLKGEIKNGSTDPVYTGAYTGDPVNAYEVDNTKLSGEQENTYASTYKIMTEMVGLQGNSGANASAYSAVKSIADGSRLNQKDIANIGQLFKNLGIKNSIPQTAEQAEIALHNIGVRVYQKSVEEVASDNTGKKHKNYQSTILEQGKLFRSLNATEKLGKEMQSGYRNVFLDNNGRVKEDYEGYVKVIGYERPDKNGNRQPTIAFTGKPLTRDLMKALNDKATVGSQNSVALSGSMYQMNMNSGQIAQTLNPNSIKSSDIKDKALQELLTSNPSMVAELYGRSVQAKFNPATKTTSLTFTADWTSEAATKYKTATGNKVGTKSFTIEVDYNVARGLGKSMNDLVTKNTAQFRTPVLLKGFETQRHLHLNNFNSAWNAAGIKSSASGVIQNGQYGIETEMSTVVNGQTLRFPKKFFPVRQGSEETDIADAEEDMAIRADAISAKKAQGL